MRSMTTPVSPDRPARIVLLVGEPGSGKSQLGRALSDGLGLPFLARDQVRRGLYFTAGAWTGAPGPIPSSASAIASFLAVIERMAALGISCVAEYVVREA